MKHHFNLKTKLAAWLAKCAMHLDSRLRYNLAVMPPVEPVMLQYQTTRIETLTANLQYRVHPYDDLKEFEEHYVYPQLLKSFVNTLIKSEFVEVRRSVHHGEAEWLAKLHVVKMP